MLLKAHQLGQCLLRKPCRIELFSTLVATEEFPFHGTVTRKAPVAANNAKSVSSNGITMISRDSNSSGTVSFKIAVAGGSSAETFCEKGAAHMLSITAFAGTSKRSGLRLMRDLENIGATVSATATREMITYDIKALPDKVETAFSSAAECIISPSESEYIVDDHKKIAQISYDRLHTCPQIALSELLHEAAFGELSPMGSSLYARSLDDLSNTIVRDYRNRLYTGGNTLVAASGISHESLKGLVEKYMGTMSNTRGSLAPSPYTGGDVRVKAKVGTTYATVAFGIDNKYVAAILSAYLNSQFSKNKLNLTAFSTNYSTSSTQLLGVYYDGPAALLGEQITSFANEIKMISSSQVASQIDLIKNKLDLELAISLEGEAATSEMISSQSVPPLNLFRAVPSNDINVTATQLLKVEPTYAVFGEISGAIKFSSVQKLFK